MFRAIRIQPEVPVTAGDVVRLFNQHAGAGNNELIAEISIPISNPAASASNAPPLPGIPPVIWRPDPNDLTLPLVLGAADVLTASTDQGITYSVAAEGGGDY